MSEPVVHAAPRSERSVAMLLRCGLMPISQRVIVAPAHEASTIAAWAAINVWAWRDFGHA